MAECREFKASVGLFRSRRINPFCTAAADIAAVRTDHMETPSPDTISGKKGIGEGDTIGPLPTIANAVNVAWAPLGVEVSECMIAPRRQLAAINVAAGC